jgi:RimJ/RimL family protein N-acetyltransferase
MTRRLARVDLCAEHACLRLHRPEDASAAFLLLDGQDEILRWLLWEGPSSPSELAEYYRHGNPFDGSPHLLLAIEARVSGELAGSLSLRFGGHPGHGDVGYWVGLPHQGRGLGREALSLAAWLAFRHLSAAALEAWVFVGNTASRRVLERAGFTLARTVPGRVAKRGRRIDQWQFLLTAGDWRRLCSAFRPEQEAVEWRAEGGSDGLDLPARPFASG